MKKSLSASFVLLLLSPAVLGAICFSVSDVSVGVSPGGIGVGDFDKDGNPDLAVALETNNVAVVRGDSRGGFGPADLYPVGEHPRAVAIADFNHDGRLDIAVTNFGTLGMPSKDPNISVLIATATGGFLPAKGFSTGGTNPNTIIAGNFNNDGNVDLAVGNYGSATVSILLGDGAGNFSVGDQSEAVPQNILSIAAADFNEDGALDVAVTRDFSFSIVVFPGTGDGHLGAAQNIPVGFPISLATGDLDHDGHVDLVVGNQGTFDVAVLRGNGAGGFSPPTTVANSSFLFSIRLEDLDGDNNLDLITVGLYSSRVTTYLGDGKGGFGNPMAITLGPVPTFVGVGDFNRDGKPDLAVSRATTSFVSILLNGLAITPPDLSAGTVGAAYPATSFVAAGGVAPYTFSQSGALPAGMMFSAGNATLSGTPAQAGSFPISLAVSSADGCSATRAYSLVVARGAAALSLTSSANPAVVGQPIILSASVSVSSVAPIPTGLVTFSASGTTLGEVSLTDGDATLQLATLPVGTTEIAAAYGGDANFLPATAPLLPQGVVSPDVPTLEPRVLLLMAVLLAAAGLALARRAG